MWTASRWANLAGGMVVAVLLTSACAVVPARSGTTGPPAQGQVAGSGRVATQTRAVAHFQEVEVDGIGTLSLQQTGSESLTIEAEDNLLPLLQSAVSGPRLRLGPSGSVALAPTRPIIYRLTVKDLSAIDLQGATELQASGISTRQLAVTVSGAGKATLAGQADSQRVTLPGTASYDASALSSRDVIVQLMGTGGVVVRTSDRLDVTIAGTGSVEYIGDPQVTQNILGLGTVRRR